jgi:hypothetical protein
MKKTIKYAACLALSGMLVTIGYAQSGQPTTPTPGTVQSTGTVGPSPKLVTDPMTSDRLAKDLNTRNSATQNQTIKWYETNYGFYGNYTVGSANYMTRYDAQGNYVETLRRDEWNNNSNVPATLRNAYGQSPYKDQTVTGYWSVTDPGKSGYYMELQDKTGTMSRVWADSQGKFTTQPYASSVSTSGSIPKD